MNKNNKKVNVLTGKEYSLVYNPIIAKFMGFTYDYMDSYLIVYKRNKQYNNEIWRQNELKFNESWDWLMQVVEKIEEMDVVASFQIEQPTIYIWSSSESSTFKNIEVDIFTKSKIQAVYEACIKFIEWYNGNK